jgi:hypothetical protein
MIQHRKTPGIALRIFSAMLLVFLSLAHKPIGSVAAQEMALANFVLPDGTIASLCLPDEDGKQGKHVDHGCEACRIASTISLPAPSAVGEPIARDMVAVAFMATPEAFHRLNFPPSAPPRGPPAVLISHATA